MILQHVLVLFNRGGVVIRQQEGVFLCNRVDSRSEEVSENVRCILNDVVPLPFLPQHTQLHSHTRSHPFGFPFIPGCCTSQRLQDEPVRDPVTMGQDRTLTSLQEVNVEKIKGMF